MRLCGMCVMGPLQREPPGKTRANWPIPKPKDQVLSPPACSPAHLHSPQLPNTLSMATPRPYSSHIFPFHIPAFSFLWLYHLFGKTLAGQRKPVSSLAGFKAIPEDTKTMVKS